MTSIYKIASSGLNAFARAIEVTGNNINNLRTKGYSRQTAIFRQQTSNRYGNNYIGSGVEIERIKRNADAYANRAVRETLTLQSEYDVFYKQASQIDKLLSQEGTSISVGLQNFFTSLSQMNIKPDSVDVRNTSLRQTQLLVDKFHNVQTQLDEAQVNANDKIVGSIDQMNNLAQYIADLNTKLASGREVPELLDARDNALEELAQFSNVQVIRTENGSVNVSIGDGTPLVVGGQTNQLKVQPGDLNKYTQIVIASGSGSVDITRNMQSGSVGGQLKFQTDILGQASSLLGQMAIGLAQKFNAQHHLGMDMNNLLGKDFFTNYNDPLMQSARSIPETTNTGTGVLSVAISDVSALTTSDYQLRVTNAATGAVEVLRLSDGTVSNLTLTNTPPAPPAGRITIDGLTIDVDNAGNLTTGDQFDIIPTRGAARDFVQKITEAREIALASPVRTTTGANNTGLGTVRLDTLLDTTAVAKEFRVEFLSGSSYQIVNVTDSVTTGPFAFTPNQDNTIPIPDSVSPSYQLIISGLPKTGDTFTSQYNSGGIADNRNGLVLSTLSQAKFLNNGDSSVFDRYSSLTSYVGTRTFGAKNQSDAADTLCLQMQLDKDSISGVNIDEEGSNLLFYQKAYQAAAQVMNVANQVFDTLFAIMR